MRPSIRKEIGVGSACLALAVAALFAMFLPLRANGEDSVDSKAANAETAAVTIPNRPIVPGVLEVRLRTRREHPRGSGKIEVSVHPARWNASETAIIICDMWDDHYCRSAAQRVDAMAPKMNRVITAARNHGVMIIHAPSGCMDQYEGTPYRLRMQQAPQAEAPIKIEGWCYLDPETEGPLPIDDQQSPCDDPIVGKRERKYTRQHEAIKIIGYDGVSDSGREIYNWFRANGIKNVVLMGVHTNMCVLGRPFGIRQMVRLGFNVALCRDLTDAMYDPRQYPYVSHTRGTELVVEHIERYWCPSIESGDLTRVIPGSNDPRADVSRSPAGP